RHAVGDRRGGGEGGDVAGVALAQVGELQLEVLRPLGAGPADALDPGGKRQVLVEVGLVDHDVIDAALFEGDPVVLGLRVDEGFVLGAEAFDLGFELLHRQPAARRAGRVGGGAVLVDLPGDVRGAAFGGHGDALEAGVGDDDHV